jgi:ABC-type transport system substrate-binding protein
MRGLVALATILAGIALMSTSVVAGSPTPAAVLRVDTVLAGSLDPLDADGSLEGQIGRATCLNLLTQRPRDSDTPQLAPEAAGFPEVSADGRTYTFGIRPGQRFSGGERVTAMSFARAIVRALGSSGPGRRAVRSIVGAGDVDPAHPVLPEGVRARGRRLIVRLRRPAADFAAWVASPYLCATSKSRPRTPPAPGQADVDTAGPYFVATSGLMRILRANRYYRGPRAPRFDAIVFDARKPGGGDWVPGRELTPRDHVRLAGRYGINRGRYWASPVARLTYLRLDQRSFPSFANFRIRRAFAYAVDRIALARALGTAAGDPTDQSLPPQLTGYRDAAIYRLRGEPERARAAAGRPLELSITCRFDCPLERALQRSLVPAGITLRLLGCFIPEGCHDQVEIRRLAASQRDGADFLRELARDQRDLEYFDHLALIGKADGLRGRRRAGALAALDARLSREPWYAIPLYVERDRHFFSARVGCVRFDPVYGLDVAALCLRRR